jgi:hypothetical protein
MACFYLDVAALKLPLDALLLLRRDSVFLGRAPRRGLTYNYSNFDDACMFLASVRESQRTLASSL